MCRVGLVGYGSWGANLARNLAQVVEKPAFICDHSADRLAASKAAFPNVCLVADWRDALAQPADGIVISTPSNHHFRMASEALSAGRHVFIEKPFALSVNHAEVLVEQASRLGLILMIDHTYLFSPAIRAAARLIAEGAIGLPTQVTSQRFNTGGIRYDAPIHWDLASHDLAILDYLFPALPESVSANFGSCGHAVDLLLRFPIGMEARISVSWVADAKRRIFEVQGTRGSLRIDDLQPRRKLRYFEADPAIVKPDGK